MSVSRQPVIFWKTSRLSPKLPTVFSSTFNSIFQLLLALFTTSDIAWVKLRGTFPVVCSTALPHSYHNTCNGKSENQNRIFPLLIDALSETAE